jgi:NTE family protein
LPGVNRCKVYSVIQLIYRARTHEGHSKDTSSRGVAWKSTGALATRTRATHCHADVLKRHNNHKGFFTFDLAVIGRE